MTVAGPPADFLSRLAARALGLNPTGAPRISSIFEPPAEPSPAPSAALDPPEDAEAVPPPPPAPDVEPALAMPAPAPASPAAPAVTAEPFPDSAPRLAQQTVAATAVVAAAPTAWEEPELLTGAPRHSPSAAAPAASVREPAPGSRPMARVPATPRLADRGPGPVEAKLAPAAAPATTIAPGLDRPAAFAPQDRPLTFAMPLAVPFAPPDRPRFISPTEGTAVLPRRERRSAFTRDAAAAEGPSVNITIGRVEVRAAVAAAAESRVAPAPRGEPPQSLADYLKRRDRAR